MITSEQIAASHGTKSEHKILFNKVGLEKERTEYLSKYLEES